MRSLGQDTEIRSEDRRILIVDDDEDVGTGLAEMLEAEGYSVAFAITAASAEGTAISFNPQLALIDVRLGRTSGLDLVSELKKTYPDLICVMVTGNADKETAINALRRGAYDYLSKPVDPQELFAALGRCFDKLRLEKEKKESISALHVALKEAEAATRAKSEFLATMSHELRTPLNAVIGFSDVITSEAFGPGNAKYRDYAKDINESGQHLLSLINDILDLSKVESGADELDEDDIEIPDVTQSVLVLVKGRAHKGGVVLETDLAEELPMLRADERKLKQILVNLLSNAIKFTEAGGKVGLRAWCQQDSGLVFQIADTGIGIPLEDIPKALSQFGQIHSDLNRQYEGTGLGLPLTKALVELHGGTLDIQSQVGTGTTVTVRFPAERTVALLDNSGSLDVSARAAS